MQCAAHARPFVTIAGSFRLQATRARRSKCDPVGHCRIRPNALDCAQFEEHNGNPRGKAVRGRFGQMERITPRKKKRLPVTRQTQTARKDAMPHEPGVKACAPFRISDSPPSPIPITRFCAIRQPLDPGQPARRYGPGKPMTQKAITHTVATIAGGLRSASAHGRLRTTS